jgi:16S rRNA (adenine1518-N6/adenine1519-N6)-dimethyltransferase
VNPDSPAEIRALLTERGLALKKRWGQNFLVNRGARERLVGLLDPGPEETVWEIGPGLGSMTGPLLPRVRHLVAFEVDRGLCRYLEEAFGSVPSFTLVPGDFMDTWKESASRGHPQAILGNLPYRSASLMIADLVQEGMRPRCLVFTVQKELADRMAASPGGKDYSSFSVLCQSSFHVTARGDLKPGSFYPVPEVVSSIIELRPRDDAPVGAALSMLNVLARGLFSSRRKTLRNNLDSLAGTVETEAALAALEGQGVDPGDRAERLSPETFVRLARALAATPKCR